MTSFLYASLTLFLIWLGFLLFSKATRKEQLIMSLVGLVITPAAILIASVDYRSVFASEMASFGIEDFIFAFSLFGIAAVIYQALVGKRARAWRGERYKAGNKVAHWFAHLLIIIGIWVFTSFVMVAVFSMIAIHAFIVGGIMIGIYVIADRHDLLFNALLSGIMVAVLIFIIEQIFFLRLYPETLTSITLLSNASGYVIGSVPLEEIFWAAVVGFSIGPLYEYLRHERLIND